MLFRSKETNATVLPRWIGWDKVKPTYNAEIKIANGIKEVIIDTTKRLADIYHLDNSTYVPISYSFDHRLVNRKDAYNYELFARPDLWYNGFDGIKTGLHFNGNYMNYKHIFDANLWFNTGALKQNLDNGFDLVNYRFNYRNAIDKQIQGATFFISSKFLDGLSAHSIGFEKSSNSEKSNLYAYFKSMYRPDSSDVEYLIHQSLWEPLKFNNTINIGLDHEYNYLRGNGKINVNLKSSSLFSDYNYTMLSLSAINNNNLGKIDVRTRVFGQVGMGQYTALESALYLAGGNPEEMMENKYMRSTGFFPKDWEGYGITTNHLHYGGGLNLRGYAGYQVAEQTPDSVTMVYKGNTGLSANVEIDFNKLIGWKPRYLTRHYKINTYIFTDAGIINSNNYAKNEPLRLAQLRADAGVGTTFAIKKFGPLDLVKPLTIRFDMPLYLSHIPFVENSNFDFRWILGINRTF